MRRPPWVDGVVAGSRPGGDLEEELLEVAGRRREAGDPVARRGRHARAAPRHASSSPRSPSSRRPSGSSSRTPPPAERRRTAGRRRPSSSSPRTCTRTTPPRRKRPWISSTWPLASTRPRSTMATGGAQLLQLGEDVAADQDGLAQRPQLAQQLAQLHPGPRVQARAPARRGAAPAARAPARGRGTGAAACRG